MQIQKVEKAGFMEPHNSLFLKLEVVLFLFLEKNLLNWLSSSQIVRWDLPYVDQPWNSKYRLYRRSGTLETISQIKVSDLLNVKSTQVWQKL